MARRSTPTTRKRIGATSAARTPTERSSIVHSSLYLPEPVYEALRKIAFDERVKIHDLVLEGIDAALRRRGYPSVERPQGREEAVEVLGRLGQRALRSGGRHRCLHAGQSRLEGRFLGVVERGLHHCAALALETLEHLICGDFAHEHE